MTTFYWVCLLFVTNTFTFVFTLLWTVNMVNKVKAEEDQRLLSSRDAWQAVALASGISIKKQ